MIDKVFNVLGNIKNKIFGRQETALMKYYSSAFKIYYFLSASDGLIDQFERDAALSVVKNATLKNFEIIKNLDPGKDPEYYEALTKYLYELLSSLEQEASSSYSSISFESELANSKNIINDISGGDPILYGLQLEELYGILVTAIISDLILHENELIYLDKINLYYDVHKNPRLIKIKEKLIFELGSEQIISYYKFFVPLINSRYGKLKVNSFLNLQYEKWKAIEHSKDESERNKSLYLQKEIMNFKRHFR